LICHTKVWIDMHGTSFSRTALFGALAVLVLLIGNITTTGASGAAPRLAAAAALPTCNPLTVFNSGNFSVPTHFSNQFYPLVPGTQFVLDGYANLGGGVLPHRIVFTVTDLTKVVNGVQTRVLWDTDTDGGELVESELAFQAQDNAGNVWVLGEYPEEYSGGQFTGAPYTWVSGLNGAVAGVLVPGNPQLGSPAFSEGISPTISFSDCGQVMATGSHICAQGTCYDNVLTINEWAPPDPAGGYQQKYYAPGVGNFQIGAMNDPQGETLVLTSVNHLDRKALEQARNAALALDQHGNQVSTVYSQTPHAVPDPVFFLPFVSVP
jgi:hypothetical protein